MTNANTKLIFAISMTVLLFLQFSSAMYAFTKGSPLRFVLTLNVLLFLVFAIYWWIEIPKCSLTGCSGNGNCVNGECQCDGGFSGDICQDS